jgi:hypothetical protein
MTLDGGARQEIRMRRFENRAGGVPAAGALPPQCSSQSRSKRPGQPPGAGSRCTVRYSYLSAWTGSTCVARCAGHQVASAPAAVTTTITMPYATGSAVVNPNM